MGHLLCLFNPGGCLTSTLARSTLGDLFNALTSWVLSSVQWLLGAVGDALASASESSTVVNAATPEFTSLVVLAPLLMVTGLLVATLQALRHGDASSLWRVYLGVAPASVLAIALARPLAALSLEAVNQLSNAASANAVSHEAGLITAFAAVSSSTLVPGFGLFLLAVAVVAGSWLLWCELIVRTVVLTLLLVCVPIIVPLSTFPALRRLGWRLAETFFAVAVSKFFIVVALALGLDELQGSSATQVITGAVTLLLATGAPFILLRLIPFVEQSALHNLEGLRQRATRAVQNAPSSPAGGAVRAVMPVPPLPEPPVRPVDLGLEMWEGGAEMAMPPLDGEPPPPPIGEPQLRGGHVAYHLDEFGPVVGWHFDE